MRKRNGLAALALALACGAVSAEDPPADAATILVVREDAFSKVEIVTKKTLPPQFDVMLDRDMPTPGWQFRVDGLDVLKEQGRIVARVSQIPPGGVVSQVITPMKLRLELGTLERGTYLLEVWMRQGTSKPYRLAQAKVLMAGGR